MTGEMSSGDALKALEDEVVSCRNCPRLVAYRTQVAGEKKPQFAQWTYWGRPVPGFGDPIASLVIIGLAPAAHGGNRTGRVFTGDRSGDFLIKSLHSAGFANQQTSTSRNDGLTLEGAYITAAVKCAPPDNKPEASEITNCSNFLSRELDILRSSRAILCLGQTAYTATLRALANRLNSQLSLPKFAHGLELYIGESLPRLFVSYHPSPRNTQTGKLTRQMFASLLRRVKKTIRSDPRKEVQVHPRAGVSSS